MKIASQLVKRPASAWFSLGLLGVLALGACVDDQPGLSLPDAAGSSGSKSSAGSAHGGSSAPSNEGGSAGTSEAAAGNAPAGGGDMPAAGGSSSGGTTTEGTAGTTPDIAGTGPGASGAGGDGNDDAHVGPACVFHTTASAPEMGAGGAGPTPTVTLQASPFVGSYLADAQGRTLYMYGADLPGNCSTPPQSACVADCLLTWPVFDAGERTLPPELADAGFGSVARPEGGFQTTYMGWPLYYYKSDLTLGQMTGQGKGKVWHAAELTPPSVVIMKAGAVKYLADGAGRTLYVSADDQKATGDADPVSNCNSSCLKTFEAFHDQKLSLVSSLEPLDFSVFVHHGAGGLQLAYKGQPLYRAATDQKAGDMTGTAVTGFTAAVP